MVKESKKMFLNKGRLATGLIFFLLCYVYLWLIVKPDLIYHGFGTLVTNIPEFVANWEFLKNSLSIPGGLVMYLYGLLSQGYYASWLGSLLIVLVALCLFELSRWHYAYIGHPHSTILPFFSVVMVVLIYNHYEHPLSICLALSVGLSFSLGFEKIPVRRIALRMAIFCLMAAIGYWLAGAGGVVVFSLMTIVYLLFIRRDWLPTVLTFPVTIAIIWLLAEYVFHISPKQAFSILIPSPELTEGMTRLSKVLVFTLFAFMPVTALLIFVWRILFNKNGNIPVTAKTKSRRSKTTRSVNRRRGSSFADFLRYVKPVVPFVVLTAGLYFSSDTIHRQIVVMNYLARREQWPEVLQLGHRLPKDIYNIYCNHDINRALYHAGRLGYDMLCFPQNPHALLLTHEQEEASMTQLKMCDTYIGLGNVNYAEKLASEFLATEGRMGMVLEKLAWINIIKGQEDTARIYLNALKKDLVHRDNADSMLSSLKNGFEPDEAAYIHKIGSYIRRDENPRLYNESIEEMLTGLLRQNPGNRMAFEYLMACYLLAGELEKIAAYIGRSDQMGYQEIPTLYQEAMLIYQGLHGRRPDSGKLDIKPETVERYNRFVRLSNSMQPQNRQAVLQRLVREFGTSYFFYYRFTISRPAGAPQR
jgi:hypothetical protein